jgi:hypothetical protein
MATFRKVKMSIRHGNGYGQYVISAHYKGKDIEVRTTISTIYDWLNDDSDKHQHQEAKRTAYILIWRAYELSKQNR